MYKIYGKEYSHISGRVCKIKCGYKCGFSRRSAIVEILEDSNVPKCKYKDEINNVELEYLEILPFPKLPSEHIDIYCKTEDEINRLLEEADKQGYRWRSGDKLSSNNYWYSSDGLYSFWCDKTVSYGENKTYYSNNKLDYIDLFKY